MYQSGVHYVSESYHVGLKTLLHEGLPEPEVYSDLVLFTGIIGNNEFSEQIEGISFVTKQ